ncbi:glycosyltransferase 9 family protein [Yersinia ruckeri]|uniref:glycosyltransferase family 9 protein n=1 Tax=Yersinia ruckeri TaxID=29486 RepID=UPI0005AC2E87|nr:glycosyltransferase family 9 protein [Yersinia ruckeri]AJI93660.1 glycosyltransferase 9 family protein [Yersinia ruckeri]MCW6567011.1 glycosyltransferase family 9 protein [Yersinia ruckeri]
MHRILVIRIDFLGDMVCTTALIHAMKRRWPAAEIHVLANKYNREALKNNQDISAIHTYVYSKQCERNLRPGKLAAIFDRLALIWRLRRLRFDILVIPNGGMNKNSIQFAKQLNVSDCRWHTKATEFDDRNSDHIANRAVRHEALSGFALLPELGYPDISSLRLHIYPEPQLQAKWQHDLGVKSKLRVGLFISNKSEQRRWSWDKWHALATKLSPQMELLIFHDPVDHPTEQQLGEVTARWLATPSIPDLVAAMSQLDLVISADSAPVHLSAALDIPVVALFEARPEKYLRWYPLVRHVMVYAGSRVDDISVDAVETAVHKLANELSG